MLSDRARDALQGIRINVESIRDFIEGIDLDAFEKDRRTLYAVTRALEIISEASRRVPDEIKERYADLPWRAIRDAGNVYRHSYDRVAASLVWDTARDQLEGLWNAVMKELEADRLDRERNTG